MQDRLFERATGEALVTILRNREDSILSDIRHLSAESGYGSRANMSWRASVRALTRSAIEAVAAGRLEFPLRSTRDYESDGAVSFVRDEARLHRTRGVPLVHFVGQLINYRIAYSDVIRRTNFGREPMAWSLRYLDAFFRHQELAAIDAWCGDGGAIGRPPGPDAAGTVAGKDPEEADGAGFDAFRRVP